MATTKTLRASISFLDVLTNTTTKTLAASQPASPTQDFTCEKVLCDETRLAASATDAALNFGGIGTVKVFAVYLSGAGTIKLNAEGTGHSIGAAGGWLILFGDVNSATVTNDTPTTVLDMTVIIGGDT